MRPLRRRGTARAQRAAVGRAMAGAGGSSSADGGEGEDEGAWDTAPLASGDRAGAGSAGGDGSSVDHGRDGGGVNDESSDSDEYAPYAAVKEANARERERAQQSSRRRKSRGRVARAMLRVVDVAVTAVAYPPLWLLSRCCGLHKGINPPA